MPRAESPRLRRVLVPMDAMKVARLDIANAVEECLDAIAACVGPVERMNIGEREGAKGFDRFLLTSSFLQIQEVWQCHGAWIESTNPESSVLTRENLRFGAESTVEQIRDARTRWDALRAHIRARVPPGCVLCLPSASDVAPLLELEDLSHFVRPSMSMLSIAVLGGLPQLSLPLALVGGLPVGVSLVGAPGADERLLELGRRLNQ